MKRVDRASHVAGDLEEVIGAADLEHLGSRERSRDRRVPGRIGRPAHQQARRRCRSQAVENELRLRCAGRIDERRQPHRRQAEPGGERSSQRSQRLGDEERRNSALGVLDCSLRTVLDPAQRVIGAIDDSSAVMRSRVRRPIRLMAGLLST